MSNSFFPFPGSSLLSRLLEDWPRQVQANRWLDKHREDVAILVKEAGLTITADLLNLDRGTLSDWAKRNGLKARRY